MSKSKNLKEKITEKFTNWCNDTTTHAVPHIAQNRNWLIKLMWLLAFLTSFAYCIFLLVQNFTQYFNYSVSITIQRVQETPLKFPAVTFCNINPFNEKGDVAYNYFESNNVANIKCFGDKYVSNGSLFYDCYNSTSKGANSSDQAFSDFIDSAKRFVASDSSLTTKTRYALGYSLDKDMLVSCNFNGLQCNEKNFTTFWHNEYGNCYTLNTSKLVSSVSGNRYGLTLELTVMPPNGKTRFALQTGLYLVVHNETDLDVTLKKGFNIKTGTNTYVAINRQFINKQSSPYSNCLIDLSYFKNLNSYSSILYGYFNYFNVTYYDQDFCIKLCYQDKLISKCNCSSLATPPLSSTSYCLTSDEVACLNKFDTLFSTSDLNSLCGSACLEECSIVEYDASVTMSNFPTLTYLQNLQSGVSASLFPQNVEDIELLGFGQQGFLRTVINYDNLFYTTIDESPQYSIYDFIGLIGGQVGLCLGISLLFVAEIVDLLINLIAIFITHKKKKSETNGTTPHQATPGVYPLRNFVKHS